MIEELDDGDRTGEFQTLSVSSFGLGIATGSLQRFILVCTASTTSVNEHVIELP